MFLWFFCDLLDALLENFGRLATTGKVHHCSMFSPFVENGSHCGLLKSRRLKIGFGTHSFIEISYLVSHLLLDFFRSQQDVLLFKTLWCTSFVRQALFRYFWILQVWHR
ncbi:hypothetical protein ATANTOWER_013243 [Ataeniobius toweri]|uniref:Secreted protein n=1 Tax=Ataeniobius toweri TaxID=208326 RepID=A0ABU7AL88_9TELE|nr:hypothetical protein [Ataeniobius toweri]